MNLANKLTIFRMILVPIIVIIPYLGIETEFLGINLTFWLMELIFVIASITDKLDGYIARSKNQVTTFGKFLDPIADKILVLATMTMLVEFGKLPAWIPIVVLTREFLVSGYRLVAVQKNGAVISASVWGKLKTVTQMVAIILMLIDVYSYGAFIFTSIDSTPRLIINVLATSLMTISVIATIFSGVDYIKGGKELFKD
jgi:CDP-diacylglycerol--glycerol-3-phosphate 3-phosphatidyltransferase